VQAIVEEDVVSGSKGQIYDGRCFEGSLVSQCADLRGGQTERSYPFRRPCFLSGGGLILSSFEEARGDSFCCCLGFCFYNCMHSQQDGERHVCVCGVKQGWGRVCRRHTRAECVRLPKEMAERISQMLDSAAQMPLRETRVLRCAPSDDALKFEEARRGLAPRGCGSDRIHRLSWQSFRFSKRRCSAGMLLCCSCRRYRVIKYSSTTH